MSNKFLFLSSFALIILCSTVSQAQIADGTYTNWDIQKSINTQSIINNNTVNSVMMSGAMKGKSGAKGRRKSAGSKKPVTTSNNAVNKPPVVKTVDTTFTNSGSYLMPAEFARNVTKNGGNVAKQQKVFEDALAEFQQAGESKNFNPNDVARSGETLMMFCLEAVYGEKLNTNQQNSIYNQLKEKYGADASFSSLSDIQKQKLNETAILLSKMVYLVYMNAKDSGISDIRTKSNEFASGVFEKFTGVPIDKAYIYPDRVKW